MFLQKDDQDQSAQDTGAHAHPQTSGAAQEAIEISVSLPGGKSVSPMELLFSQGSPPQQEPAAASASEEEWEDAETGQPVHPHNKVCLFSNPRSSRRTQAFACLCTEMPSGAADAAEAQEGMEGGGAAGSQEARPADWRERMRQRQKYWSLSQGFRFGRKLADWGGREGDGGGPEGGAAGAGATRVDQAMKQKP